MSKAEVFGQLSGLLARHRGDALVTTDSDNHYALARPDALGKPVFLASVQIEKSDVAVHLFPVYERPALLEGVSHELL